MCDLELRCLADAGSAITQRVPSMDLVFEKRQDPTRYAAAVLCGLREFRQGRYPIGFDDLERDDPTTFTEWMTVARTGLHAGLRGLSPDAVARAIRGQLGGSRRPPPEVIIQNARKILFEEIFPELDRLQSCRPKDLVQHKLSIGPREAWFEFVDKNEGFDHRL